MSGLRALFRGGLVSVWVGLSSLASLAAAQPQLLQAPHPLPSDLRTRWADAASDSSLEPWQRKLMMELTGRNGDAIATRRPLPGVVGPVRTAAEDGVWIDFFPPPGRSGPAAIYDPPRARMVVFGGYDGNYRNDVWALSLSGSLAWTELTPAGNPPSGRYGHAVIYDPLRDRMLVFGGWDGSLRSDLWALSLSG